MDTSGLVRSFALLATVAFACIAWLSIPARRRTEFFDHIGALVWFALITEAVGLFLCVIKEDNGLVYSVFAVVEFLIVMSLAASIRPGLRMAAVVAGTVGCVGLFADVFFGRDHQQLANFGIIITTSISTVFLLLVLWHIAETSEVSIWKDPRTIACLGLLMSFATIAPVMGTIWVIWQSHPALIRKLYLIVQIMSMVRYVLIGVSCIRASSLSNGYGSDR